LGFSSTFKEPNIFMAAFIIVNLIIAIVVDAMNTKEEDIIIEAVHSTEDKTVLDIQKLRDDIKALQALMIKG